jgi:hypothetical protein
MRVAGVGGSNRAAMNRGIARAERAFGLLAKLHRGIVLPIRCELKSGVPPGAGIGHFFAQRGRD